MNNKQECTSCSFEEKLKCKKFNWRIYQGDRCDYYKSKEMREDMDNDDDIKGYNRVIVAKDSCETQYLEENITSHKKTFLYNYI